MEYLDYQIDYYSVHFATEQIPKAMARQLLILNRW